MTRPANPSLLQCILLCSLGACAPEDEAGKFGTAQDSGVQPLDAGGLDAGSVLPTPDAATGADGGSPQLDAGSAPDAGRGRDAGGGADTGTPASDASVSVETGPANEAGTNLPKFSFFVTSLSAMRTLSKNQNGFGGDLRFGETGAGAGLRGADKICAAAADLGMPGASAKQWRAFLSTSTVHAKDRVGTGPWYDRSGRLVAQNLTSLVMERPGDAHAAIRDDLPNERGEPNHAGSAEGGNNDNHDVVTASLANGQWDSASTTCDDWTSTTALAAMAGGAGGRGPRVGHSWPASSGRSWAYAHRAPGCEPSVALVQTGPGSGTGIGNGGGYGGIYCFALTP